MVIHKINGHNMKIGFEYIDLIHILKRAWFILKNPIDLTGSKSLQRAKEFFCWYNYSQKILIEYNNNLNKW